MLSPVCPWLWAKLGPVADGVVVGVALDAVRPRRDLVRENALLRHPIVELRRKVPRPRRMPLDRFRLMVSAATLPGWQRVVAIVQPETVLRWHRDGFRWVLRRKSLGFAWASGQSRSTCERLHACAGQRWSTFLRNHADVTWCCEFVQTYDALFRPVFAFSIVHLGSRRVVHMATTCSPTQQWTRSSSETPR